MIASIICVDDLYVFGGRQKRGARGDGITVKQNASLWVVKLGGGDQHFLAKPKGTFCHSRIYICSPITLQDKLCET